MNYRLVEVIWVDSRGVNENWILISDTKDWRSLVMRSVGYVIYEDVDEIRIAPHLGVEPDDDEDQVCGVMTIPKRAIDKVSDLGFKL